MTTYPPAHPELLRVVDHRLHSQHGKPVSGARVQTSELDDSPLYHGAATESDAAGVVELLTPAGAVRLQAFKEALVGTASVAPNVAATAEVVVRLAPPPGVR